MDQIGAEMLEELMAAYPPERLEEIIKQAQNPDKPTAAKQGKGSVLKSSINLIGEEGTNY